MITIDIREYLNKNSDLSYVKFWQSRIMVVRKV